MSYLSEDYNPKYGRGSGGRVGKKDFSIDGRSWNYRDPSKHNNKHHWARSDRGINPNPSNTNEYKIANPLYDYDYGTVRDAAKELGIGNVDEKQEVDKIIAHIQGRSKRSNKEEEQPLAAPPPPVKSNTERPAEVKRDQQRFEETRLDRPENQMPRLEDAFRRTSDANMGAIRGGDDLNNWYQTKFVPHLEADANATMSEQGDDSRELMKSFAFNPPKLGSIKELFDKYKGEIEGLD